MKTNATIEQLKNALENVNKTYEDNISFERLEQKTSKTVIFTLRAISGKKGARYATSGRKLPKASWHVHGHLFDELFKINPGCHVYSLGKKITKEAGNWQDMSIGQGKNMSDVSIEETEDFTISDKRRYISTDGWRGFEEPLNAICGANDTGTWSDSICPSHVRENELEGVKKLLRAANIGYRQVITETSNVFCVHFYLLVKKENKEAARKLVNKYLKENSTRLLYVVNEPEKSKKKRAA